MIRVKVLPFGQLIEAAINSYMMAGGAKNPPLSGKFFERIVVNHIRHRLVNKPFVPYDRMDDFTYLEEWTRVQKAILQAYPWLSHEIEKQIARKEAEILSKSL